MLYISFHLYFVVTVIHHCGGVAFVRGQNYDALDLRYAALKAAGSFG